MFLSRAVPLNVEEARENVICKELVLVETVDSNLHHYLSTVLLARVL